MFKHILVAVDGSDHATKAVEVAGDLAQKYDSRVIIEHVVGHGKVPEDLKRMAEVEHLVESPAQAIPSAADVAYGTSALMVSGDDGSYDDRVRQLIGERLIDRAESILKGKIGKNRVTRCLDHGDPADAILERARREEADLIVIGTRGFSELKGLLMGSVSHKVCQFSDCPCVTVK